LVEFAIDHVIKAFPVELINPFWSHDRIGASNRSSVGEFDKCLKCASFWGHLVAFLRDSCALDYNLRHHFCFVLGDVSMIHFACLMTFFIRH